MIVPKILCFTRSEAENSWGEPSWDDGGGCGGCAWTKGDAIAKGKFKGAKGKGKGPVSLLNFGVLGSKNHLDVSKLSGVCEAEKVKQNRSS